MKKLAIVAAAVVTAFITFTPPVWAAEDPIPVPLKTVHQNVDAVDFEEACELDEPLKPGEVLWHFVVPSFPANPDRDKDGIVFGGDLIDVLVQFDAGTVLDEYQVQNGKGYNILTTGATALKNPLNDATGLAINVEEGQELIMNLSHTCIGVEPEQSPSPTPTPTPTPTVTPTVTPTPVPSATPTADVVEQELARTGPGANEIGLLILSLAMLATGATILWLSRNQG